MRRMIPVWFFVGCLLSIYGVLILAAGISDFSGGLHSGIAMYGLHLQLWWGAGLLILGLIYVLLFWPRSSNHGSRRNPNDLSG